MPIYILVYFAINLEVHIHDMLYDLYKLKIFLVIEKYNIQNNKLLK